MPMRANGCHDDVPVQSVGGFKPCASKLDSVAGLVDVPDFDFGMTDTAKPRKPVERKPRKPRVQRKPVESVEPVQQPEQTSDAVANGEPSKIETVTAEVAAPEVDEPDPVTAEIPEVPPRVESHEVVKTSDAIVVRKVVIPGGKSVKELSDVFGAYPRRPRGFRDSKGRRVAYVAFDSTGGVIAYRDYYTDVDTRLEEQIADYLANHNLKLAA